MTSVNMLLSPVMLSHLYIIILIEVHATIIRAADQYVNISQQQEKDETKTVVILNYCRGLNTASFVAATVDMVSSKFARKRRSSLTCQSTFQVWVAVVTIFILTVAFG